MQLYGFAASALALSRSIVFASPILERSSVAALQQSFDQLVSDVKSHDSAINSTVASHQSKHITGEAAVSYVRGNASAINSLLAAYINAMPSAAKDAQSKRSSDVDSEAANRLAGSFAGMVFDLKGTFQNVQENGPTFPKSSNKPAKRDPGVLGDLLDFLLGSNLGSNLDLLLFAIDVLAEDTVVPLVQKILDGVLNGVGLFLNNNLIV